jgi:4-hydroxythreonine-4-phosphate dehydrogenase
MVKSESSRVNQATKDDSSLRPPTAVFSSGDPNGIGPEVLLKCLDTLDLSLVNPVVFGPGDYLMALYHDLGLSFDWRQVRLVSAGEYSYPPRWGELDREAGTIALESLKKAILFCRQEGVRLLVTAPVNKEALHDAGFEFPGQTEYVASFFDCDHPTMSFFSDKLKVMLATTHIPLCQVSEALNTEILVHKCQLFRDALRQLDSDEPRIAVCGLNPHASEGGLFGSEEELLIGPAVQQLNQVLKREVFFGPLPADSLFWRAVQGEFHGVVALFHDQGLIPLKLVAFDSAVNVTLGLPIVRCSPDHGTAFDIAGQAVADPGSMLGAVKWGLRLAGY